MRREILVLDFRSFFELVTIGGGPGEAYPPPERNGARTMAGWDNGIEALFEDTEETLPRLDTARISAGVLMYRTKIIKSGDMLEVAAYPIIKQGRGMRAPKTRETGKAQKKVNAREARRRLIRKAEANFSRRSMFVTLTYREDPGEEQAHKDLSNYLRRLKYRTGKKLKYIAVTEIGHNGRVHHHVLLDGVPRELTEQAWKDGYVNCRKYQPSRQGFTGLINYMTKKNSTMDPGEEGIGKRRIRVSTGLKEPEIRVSDHKLSRRRMQAIAEETETGSAASLEKVFRGYTITQPVRITQSWYLPGAYLYAVLRKICV